MGLWIMYAKCDNKTCGTVFIHLTRVTWSSTETTSLALMQYLRMPQCQPRHLKDNQQVNCIDTLNENMTTMKNKTNQSQVHATCNILQKYRMASIQYSVNA